MQPYPFPFLKLIPDAINVDHPIKDAGINASKDILHCRHIAAEPIAFPKAIAANHESSKDL